MSQANPFDIIVEGDWVCGSSPSDEKYIGYVEAVDESGLLLIRVTQSDHEALVDTTLQAGRTKTKKLPERSASTREELRSLIDLALLTHDKEWFEELKTRLAAAEPIKQASPNEKAPKIHPRWNDTLYRS
ncbi:IDEAL domain-containing protein [Paenibacillus puerhi]|uniref:IDEAL domain-containing protein n=1 Tax=Paenibacillus puerhi TaxID=2692622 RepID=UPI001359A113|nr:IDEAL domain-containing protein [Paenibacillus puerhi]